MMGGECWSNGQPSGLRSTLSGFEVWPGEERVVVMCCVLSQYSLLLQDLSPPRCINGLNRRMLMLGGGRGGVRGGDTLGRCSIPS